MELKKGTRVLVKIDTNENYLGTISKVEKGKYVVIFDDGDTQKVTPKQIVGEAISKKKKTAIADKDTKNFLVVDTPEEEEEDWEDADDADDDADYGEDSEDSSDVKKIIQVIKVLMKDYKIKIKDLK